VVVVAWRMHGRVPLWLPLPPAPRPMSRTAWSHARAQRWLEARRHPTVRQGVAIAQACARGPMFVTTQIASSWSNCLVRLVSVHSGRPAQYRDPRWRGGRPEPGPCKWTAQPTRPWRLLTLYVQPCVALVNAPPPPPSIVCYCGGCAHVCGSIRCSGRWERNDGPCVAPGLRVGNGRARPPWGDFQVARHAEWVAAPKSDRSVGQVQRQ
jgi:hypothetical protein